jgi:nucleoside-diphosphate-sugar epimerase
VPATVLRLPKVHGRGGNADLRTVYAWRNHPDWRWTHGYVENVAAAIVLAALHPAAAGRVYNVGEEYTPTVGERMAALPGSTIEPADDEGRNFEQDIACDTARLRRELGYEEPISYTEGIRRTLANSPTA